MSRVLPPNRNRISLTPALTKTRCFKRERSRQDKVNLNSLIKLLTDVGSSKTRKKLKQKSSMTLGSPGKNYLHSIGERASINKTSLKYGGSTANKNDAKGESPSRTMKMFRKRQNEMSIQVPDFTSSAKKKMDSDNLSPK
jgi:hypothetical protein